MGDFGFGEFSRGVIQDGLQGLDVPKTVGFSSKVTTRMALLSRGGYSLPGTS